MHYVLVIDYSTAKKIDLLVNFKNVTKSSYLLQFNKWEDEAYSFIAEQIINVNIPGNKLDLPRIACEMYIVWDEYTRKYDIMLNSKYTLIQQDFLSVCEQLNSYFVDKGNNIREQTAK